MDAGVQALAEKEINSCVAAITEEAERQEAENKATNARLHEALAANLPAGLSAEVLDHARCTHFSITSLLLGGTYVPNICLCHALLA